MKIGILLLTSPENENTEVVAKLSSSAKKKCDVEIFLMDDGVYNVKKDTKAGERFSELISEGISVSLCAHTAEERGLEKRDCIEKVGFAGQYELATLVNESDRFLVFG
jgi:sulfur relay (sulfurtransferase) complex TusBCD TusD component (DsrE family)